MPQMQVDQQRAVLMLSDIQQECCVLRVALIG